MKGMLGNIGLTATLIAATFWLTGCGGGGGGGDAIIILPDDTPVTFTQPVAGIALSAGASASTTQVDLLLKGDLSTTTVPVAEAADASDPSLESTITALDRSNASPFELLTISGTGFRPTDAAISVIFRSGALEPIVVPAIAATTTTIEVAVPPLIDAGGDNVSGAATVQLFQVGQWGYSITAVQGGLTIGELPQVDAAQPAGAVVDAYLTAALNQIATFEAAAPGTLPSAFWGALAAQKLDLADLQSAVQTVMGDPTATPALSTYGGPGTVILDAEALALADRLVAAMMLRLGEALGFTTTQPLPSGVVLVAATAADCPPLTSGAWVDDFICQRQLYGQNLESKGRRGVSLGAKVEASFFLGIFGGITTNVLGQIATKGATAFELTWAALSGHIAAWATASEPPTAGETLGEVGVTILDKLAGTQGILSAAYTTVNMGAEYDAVIQDAGTTPATGKFLGTLSGSTTETGGCVWKHSLSLTLTVAGFGGNGTLIDPYYGTPDLTGIDTITLLSGSNCDPGAVINVSGFIGTVGGETGVVEISGSATIGTGGTLDLWIPNATYSGTSISGGYTLVGDAFDYDISGTVTLTQQ